MQLQQEGRMRGLPLLLMETTQMKAGHHLVVVGGAEEVIMMQCKNWGITMGVGGLPYLPKRHLADIKQQI